MDFKKRLVPLARLVRLPNVFTVPGDVAVGYWVVLGEPLLSAPLGWAVLSACGLYLAGMIFNDVFDLEEDRRDRPQRPLPAGQMEVATAILLGALALAIGVMFGGLASPHAAVTAGILATMVLLYDGKLKSTWAGPAGMGACRAAGVMLGASAAWGGFDSVSPVAPVVWLVALTNGVYIAGVTLLAKSEATTSPRRRAAIAIVVLVVGLAGHVGLWQAFAPHAGWGVGVLLVYAGWLAFHLMAAVQSLQPQEVQAAVKAGILGIVALDAAIAAAFVGPLPAAALLVFLFPAFWLGRWTYST